MPYDPMTGQNLPYSNSYSSQGMQTPLSMDVINNFPGMLAMTALGQRRGANTIMRGGFLDRESKLSRLNPITRDNRQAFGFKRNDALRRFRGDNLTDISAGGRLTRGSYVGPLGTRRQKAAKMTAQMAGESIDTASGAASRFGGRHAERLRSLAPRIRSKRFSSFFKAIYS
jgi:hypothetical protein